MFRIINNNIFITRGETAVYDAVFVTRKGSPLVLTKPKNEDEKYYIEFVVRTNTENRINYLIRNFLEVSGVSDELDIHLFDSIDLIQYKYEDENDDWDMTPDDLKPMGDAKYKYINYLHFRVDLKNDQVSYRRWDEDKEEWVDYRFRIMMPFEYGDINSIKPDTYVYEINLLGGKPDPGKEPPIDITFKKTILVPHEFKVGGSIGE